MNKLLFLFLFNTTVFFTQNNLIFSFKSANHKSKLNSLTIHKSTRTKKKVKFTISLKQTFIVEKQIYDSIDSQIEASKLQIARKEKPYLNAAESMLISMMASMDDERPRTYQEAYSLYHKKQYNRVMSHLENPQDYYHQSTNNNSFFEKEIQQKTSNVLIPSLIIGVKNNEHQLFFKVDDKYDVQVFNSSKKLKNISYVRNKNEISFKYLISFSFNQISFALFDEDENMLEHLSNTNNTFSYKGAWHLLKNNQLIPFQNINSQKLTLHR
ncbi:MAG: hypothetical protein COB02_08630 [Candidatus Cloacimonadota bacterium]|nr:MAG: hypothetical protein COB02_08630 [Candidatus Cloacimonadota bacterium]